jgi:hypothetical protein
MNLADEWPSSRRARACGDKQWFTDRHKAKDEIKRVCQRLGEARSRWRAYRCTFCNQFHIGHKMEAQFQLETVSDAIAFARTKHKYVYIPPSVDSDAAALEVHSRTDQRRWAARAADGLRGLDRYAAAKRSPTHPFNGNFYMFCQSSSAVGVPLSAIQLTESPNLMQNNRLAAQRVFSVDRAVHASGAVLMESHLRIEAKGSPAPRIYFYDDTRGPTGLIHIGYIGKHLENTHPGRSM